MHRQTVRFLKRGQGHGAKRSREFRGNHNRCSRVENRSVWNAFEIKSRSADFHHRPPERSHANTRPSDGRIACKHRASGLPACYQPVIADNRFFPPSRTKSPRPLTRVDLRSSSPSEFIDTGGPSASLNGLVLTRFQITCRLSVDPYWSE